MTLTGLFYGLVAVLVFGLVFWIVSLIKRDVSIVDSLWSLMFLLAAGVYAITEPALSDRAVLVLVLSALWALRLSGHITWRNWGEGEDYRYQNIRRNNEPHFWLKSLGIVFWLQAVLAWIVAFPLFANIGSDAPLGWLDGIGLTLFAIGFFFEAVGDYQLARFKADPANKGKVMDTGLWRYTRHPNYFGEACLWWGFYLMALSAGYWWVIFAPLLITFLLLKVSGVAMLEKDIGERRPAYRDYIRRTNAFIPGLPKRQGPMS